MTLGNMRAMGVRSLDVTCNGCGHEATVSCDRWADEKAVLAVRLERPAHHSGDEGVLRHGARDRAALRLRDESKRGSNGHDHNVRASLNDRSLGKEARFHDRM